MDPSEFADDREPDDNGCGADNWKPARASFGERLRAAGELCLALAVCAFSGARPENLPDSRELGE